MESKEQFLILKPDAEDHSREPITRPRPHSVISDVCADEPSSGGIVLDVDEEESFQSIAVSDVLSPIGKHLHSKSRLAPLGGSAHLDRGVSSRSDSGFAGISNREEDEEEDPVQHNIEETAANLSHSALQAALSDLSIEEPVLFDVLEPDDINHASYNYVSTLEPLREESQALLQIDRNSNLSESNSSSAHRSRDSSLSGSSRHSLHQYANDASLKQHRDTLADSNSCSTRSSCHSLHSLTQNQIITDRTSLKSFTGSDELHSNRASSRESLASETSRHSLQQYPNEQSLKQYRDSIGSLSTTSSRQSGQSVSQYPLDPSLLASKLVSEPKKEEFDSLIQLSLDPSHSLSQFVADSSTLVSSLTQLPFDSTTARLSTCGRSSTSSANTGGRSSNGTGSRTSGENILMLDSENSRPSTVIERPKTEGYNKSDNDETKSSNLNTQQDNTIFKRKQVFATPQVVTAANLHDVDSTFDQSIKFGHGRQGESLGDTILNNTVFDRPPVSASTPQATESQTSRPSAIDELAKYLKMADTREPLGKRIEKGEDLPVDRMDEQGDNGMQTRSTLKSPNWHELIPDTPTFRQSTNQKPTDNVEHFSLATESGQADPTSADRMSVSSQHSARSGAGSDGSSLPGPGLIRERTNYDMYNRERGNAEESRTSTNQGNVANTGLALQAPGAGRIHTSSIGSIESADTRNKSSDTLLGAYEARDAVSVTSGGSKELPHSTHASDDDRLSKRSSLTHSEAGEDAKGVSSRSSVASADTPKGTTSSFKDEKWGTKVSGMLEGISRRQNLSARVATILAGSSPKTSKPGDTPGSRIPVKVSHNLQSSSASATPTSQLSSTSSRLSSASTPKAVDRTVISSSTPSGGKLNIGNADENNQTPVSATSSVEQIEKEKEQATETPRSQKSSQYSEEDEDVERLTEEYRAILKGVSNSVELNQDIDQMWSKIEMIQPQSQEPDIVTEKAAPPPKAGKGSEYYMDPDMIDSGEETEDSLDRDVKRILSKYGRNVGSFSDAGGKGDQATAPIEGRQSPAGSAYDTDDTLAQRVQDLLKANAASKSNKNETSKVGDQQQYESVPPLSLNSSGRTEDTVPPVDLGSLKGRLREALEGVIPDGGSHKSKQPVPQQYSSDPLNDRVRQILADTNHLESETPTTSKRISSNDSPTSSIDYHNLERDLEEIQSHLESLKGDNSSRRQSNVSEQSAELRKYVEGRIEDDTLRKARAVIGESESSVASSSSSMRLEPEGGQGSNSTPAPRLPLSPLLTSGLVPMEVALDMIHGSSAIDAADLGPTSQNYSHNNSGFVYTGVGSNNLTADTETLLQEASTKYTSSFTPDVRGLGAAQDALLATVGSTTDSLVDREVMEINKGMRTGSSNKFNNDVANDSVTSLTERVSKLVGVDSPASSTYLHRTDPGLRRPVEMQSVASQDVYTRSLPVARDDGSPGYANDTSLNFSSLSPLTKKPFTAFGNVHSLFANQMNKVSSSRFDTSLEAHSPRMNRRVPISTENEKSTGRTSNYGRLSPTSRARMGEDVSSRDLSPYGREKSPLLNRQVGRISPTEHRMADDLRRTDRALSPSSQKSGRSSPRDGTSSRASTNSASRLRPYKPPGSKMTYYVESGVDGELNTSATGYSETTVESTHPGSDDAVGPTLPLSAYGSRKDPPKGEKAGVYSQEQAAAKSLGTITEQSMDENDIARHSLKSSSKPSNRSSGTKTTTVTTTASTSQQTLTSVSGGESKEQRDATATPTESRYRFTEERERSFSKTKDWLNGNWPSKEDLAAAGADKVIKPEVRSKRDITPLRRPIDGKLDDNLDKSGVLRLNVANADRRTPSQLYSAENLADTMPPKTSVTKAGRESYEPTPMQSKHQRPARVMYDNYTEKCQQLQDNYRTIKDRAEQAISTLVTSSTEPLKSDTTADVRDTLRLAQRYEGRHSTGGQGVAALEFGTPKRLGSSRLSLEMSLNDTAATRKSAGVADNNDTGMHSLNSTAKSTDNSKSSTHEFLKYHTPQAPPRQSLERPSGYRGPDYWSSKIASNYDDLSQPPKISDNEDRLMERLREEREARIIAARQIGQSEDGFQPLYPDEDEEIVQRSRSPVDVMQYSSGHRSHSPESRNKTPVNDVLENERYDDERSQTPKLRSKAPSEQVASPKSGSQPPQLREKSPELRAKSPYERMASPQRSATVDGARSPYYDSITNKALSNEKPEDKYGALPGEDILEFARKRVGHSGSQLDVEQPIREEIRNKSRSPAPHSTNISTYQTRPSEIFLRNLAEEQRKSRSSAVKEKSFDSAPVEERSSNFLSEMRPVTSGSGPDMQDMWERFSALQHEESSTLNDPRAKSLSIDLKELTSLLSNPTQHILRNSQKGTIFDQSDASPRSMPILRSNRDKEPYASESVRMTDTHGYGEYSPRSKNMQIDDARRQRQDAGMQLSATHLNGESGTAQVNQQQSNVQRDDSNGGKDGNEGDRHGRYSNNQKRNGDEDDRDKNNRDNNERDDRKYRSKSRSKGEDETEEETTEEESGLMESTQNDDITDSAQKRKMAWVIKDEELLSIPEDNTLDSVSSDFTTSSEIDSDGKLVTKTTKRHLPNDPKLLKLQQKIAKQKEKYKRVQIMAQRRHNKIMHLEQLENKLEQQVAAQGVAGNEFEATSPTSPPQQTTVDSLGTVTSKTTSTPSHPLGVSTTQHEDSTLGVSNITSTSTLTHGTVEDMTFEQSPGRSESGYAPNESGHRRDESGYRHNRDADESSICQCCHKKRAKSAENSREYHHHDNRSQQLGKSPPHKVSRSQSPPRSPQKRRHLANTYPSPSTTRRKKEKIQQPPGMKLREVDYNNLSISPNKTLTTPTLPEPHNVKKASTQKKSVYMEIDLPKAVPKTKPKKRTGASPSGRRDRKYRDGSEENEKKRQMSRDRERTSSKKMQDAQQLSNASVQVTPKTRTRDFGATCPTPMVPSPPVQRNVRQVTMVSEAIQTDAGPIEKDRKVQKKVQPKQKTRRDRSPGMFTPESSENENENDDPAAAEQEQWHTDRQTVKHQPKTVKAAMAGITWFLPMKEAKPWKKPLQERRANAVAMGTWPQMDEYSRRTLEDLAFRKTDSLGRVPSDYFPKHVPEDEEEEKQLTGLQRAFDKRMQVFISKSRERQRLVRMRAEERSLTAVHGRDRDVIFKVDHRRMANVDAHPLSDLHFKPKKRIISKTEMREMAAVKYKKLPEVLKACEAKKRQEYYKTNRIRAQIYKQKVLNTVLKKRGTQLRT